MVEGRKIIHVNDRMQHGYSYELAAPMGKDFDSSFKPDLTPKEMLKLGVFGGVYMRDCRDEFPADWFEHAKLAPESERHHVAELNFFNVNASQSLSMWRAKGWISECDPRGWFQWYCRYYMGRRLPDDDGKGGEDARQIRRWKAIGRHIAQVRKNCRPGDFSCRTVQRQAILHWAYDSRMI